jgi:hypothetical protein
MFTRCFLLYVAWPATSYLMHTLHACAGCFSNFVFPTTPTMVAAMSSGSTYVNINTTTYPSGEIRGQLLCR